MIPGRYGLNYILFPRSKTLVGKKISREVMKAKLWWSMTIIQWISSWFDTWYKFQQKKNKEKSHWKQNMVVKMIKKIENTTRVIIYFQVLSKIIIMIEKFFPFNVVLFTFLFDTKMRMLLSKKSHCMITCKKKWYISKYLPKINLFDEMRFFSKTKEEKECTKQNRIIFHASS